MKVLAIGAHFDDVDLGCGGSLLRHKSLGDEIYIHILSDSGFNSASGRKRSAKRAKTEATAAAKQYGATLSCSGMKTHTLTYESQLAAVLDQLIVEKSPDRLYLHSPADPHLDHSAVGAASLLLSDTVRQVLLYRSSVHQHYWSIRPTFFIDITPWFIEKLAIIRSYQSESVRHEEWTRIVTSSCILSGSVAGCEYAEAFELFKWVE